MSNDIYDILRRFDTLTEGTTTPDSVKHGLNNQQKSVKQLPALFKPKSQKILGGNPNEKNPMSGYMVGSCEESIEPATQQDLEDMEAQDCEHEIGNDYQEVQEVGMDQGKQLHVGDPITVTAPNEYEGKTGEISEFAPSGAFVIVRMYNGDEVSMHLSDVEYNDYADEQDVDDAWNDDEPMEIPVHESYASEDVVSQVKQKLGDYLRSIEDEIKKDPALKDKTNIEIDRIGPAVKTIKTDDGNELKIHGNEDDGFRITIKNKESKAHFESLDHAVTACEMFCNHRRAKADNINADYVEERK